MVTARVAVCVTRVTITPVSTALSEAASAFCANLAASDCPVVQAPSAWARLVRVRVVHGFILLAIVGGGRAVVLVFAAFAKVVLVVARVLVVLWIALVQSWCLLDP